MLKLYTLSNCDSCRAAKKWLRTRGIAFEEIAIREHPPTRDELRAMLDAYAGELRRLFNTSGRDYRDRRLGEKLSEFSDATAIKLLAENGNLVKRPFLVGDGLTLVGFNQDTWAAAFARR
jgi:arsenate reductase